MEPPKQKSFEKPIEISIGDLAVKRETSELQSAKIVQNVIQNQQVDQKSDNDNSCGKTQATSDIKDKSPEMNNNQRAATPFDDEEDKGITGEKADYDLDVEECPSQDSEGEEEEKTDLVDDSLAKNPINRQFTRQITLGEVTVHGGRKKETDGECDFSGLASYYMDDPTPVAKKNYSHALELGPNYSEKLADEQPPEERVNFVKQQSLPHETKIKKEP